MSNLLNQPLCATNYGNTGFGDCFLEPSQIVGGFQVPSNFSLSQSDLGTLQAVLQAKISAAIGTRIFPYANWISVTDNTEDVNITTTDYGAKYINRDGFYDFTFRYLIGGVQLHNDIQKNAGSGKYFLFYDSKGNLYGKRSGTTMRGIKVDIFYADPWRLPTGADAASYRLRFIINPSELNFGNLAFYSQQDFSYGDISGIQELELWLFSLASNVAKVGVRTKISKVDLHPIYGNSLSNTGFWSAAKRTDGSVIPLTSIAEDGANHVYIFTFNSGIVSGMAPTDAIVLKGANASVLLASGITPYEAHEGLAIELPGS